MKRLLGFGAAMVLLGLIVAGVWARPVRVAADDGGYPYAAKPCIWAPHIADGSGVNWCPDYDFGDQANDASVDNVISPLGYYYRNCTDYTAWKVSTLGVEPAQYKGLGNARDWAATAPSHGITVDDQPAVGAVAVRLSGKYGHTAFVQAVDPSGRISVSQYNYGGDGNYSEQSGTPAELGFTRFAHFEAYERAPTVTVSPSVSALAEPLASEPIAAPVDAPKKTDTEAPKAPDAASDEASSSDDTPPAPDTTPPIQDEEPVAPVDDTTSADTPVEAPAEDEEPPAPPADAVEAEPQVWQMATTPPPSVATAPGMPTEAPAALTHDDTIQPVAGNTSTAAAVSWSLVGLSGVAVAAQTLPLRALGLIKRR